MDPEEPGHVCPIAKLLASTPRVHRPLDFGNSLMVDLAAPAWEAREMTWKALGGLALKVIVLTLALFVIYSAASLIVGLGETDPQPADGMAAMKYLLLLVCFLFTVVLSYPIMRSRWSGWPLIATVAVVLYGVSAFLSGIETAVFLKYLVDMAPGEMVPKLLMQGAIVAVLRSPCCLGSREDEARRPDGAGRGKHAVGDAAGPMGMEARGDRSGLRCHIHTLRHVCLHAAGGGCIPTGLCRHGDARMDPAVSGWKSSDLDRPCNSRHTDDAGRTVGSGPGGSLPFLGAHGRSHAVTQRVHA